MRGKLGSGSSRGNGQNKTARDWRAVRRYTLRDLLLLGRVPRDALDVRPADPDVGELTVAEIVQLGNALVVALPCPDDANKAGKHVVLSSLNRTRPVPATSAASNL